MPRIAAVLVLLAVRAASAGLLSDAMSVSGDSISRGFNANTSSCNYGDNVARNWASGDDHGAAFCSAGGATFSHGERLECFKAGDVSIANDAASGADMRGDFFDQAVAIRSNMLASPAPRYVPVFMGHNDVCTNTESRTGNSCGGDQDPNNYCRTTNVAFEREFRRGMDQLIQIPSVRVGVSALVRVSQLCNFTGKDGCGLILFGDCGDVWGLVNICSSLTVDCSSQRRLDAYNTALGYNEILERVTAEYAAIPAGGASATGAVKAADVQIRYGEGAFHYKFSSGDVSCCDCFHPSDQGQAKIAQFGWDGLQCSAATPCCAPSADPLTNARCDLTETTSFYPSGFWAGGVTCGNAIVDPGEQCDDGNNAAGDCCSPACQFEPAGTACPADANACTNDVCNAAGVCTHPANTAPCNDGLFCTVGDACSGGTCQGTPRDCSAAGDQCRQGVCNDTSDACVAQPRPNGTACTDGNACTRSDACQAGVCAGANPVVCTAQDECHVAGACDPGTGACSNPPAPNGTGCTDGNACTQTDTCQGGACTGANPVVCTAQDQCHVAGACDPGTGACSNPPAPNGTGCTDGDACTQSDTCQAGACTGASPVVCTAQDQCHLAGTCDPATGVCSNPPAPDGAACTDGDACTQPDACQAGACVPGAPVVCTALDQCHDAGTCSPGTGLCSNPTKPNGAACSDGSACTQTDACQSGVCTGANPVVCTAQDQCHLVGTCDPQTGVCSNPARPDGAACSDGDACTVADSCQAGACAPGAPVACTAEDDCHDAGVCNPATGVCSSPAKPDGTSCSDGDACTQTDTCQSGHCAGADPVACAAPAPCQGPGACDPGTGICTHPPLADETPCDDGDLCTQTDVCRAGTCAGEDPVACGAPDACRLDGACDPGTGACAFPNAPDGTGCDDGDACTVGDACAAGACTSAPACGDGVVQAGCGETCDTGAANGTDQCCSAACTLVDGDGDALCDAVDPCTGGVPLARATLKIGRQTTPPGDDTLAWRGELTAPFPFAPPLEPAARGVRLVLGHGTSAILDVTIAGGVYAGSPGVGWKTSRSGIKWVYADRRSEPHGGITKVTLQQVPSTPGLVKFRVKGKRQALPPSPGNPALTAALVLDPPAAASGQCGESTLPCTFNGSGAARRCLQP